ncbi:VOC family protein [Rhizobium sp. KVB221]|uniref:VOC family protein n=1 Tax=Rhizobium setariae TaxID=2801340 RepID=A0A937CQU2_9HYPH|nr:VOC family protein [Rhizobium setariae]MBL0374393.1 VOC family protein [Rhizobium setariae]
MLSNISIGANDPVVSGQFYEAVLVPLGYERHEIEGSARFSLRGVADKDNGPGTVWIQKPFDGKVATAGNGMMPAFRAADPETVQRLHAAGIAAGGTDEGPPGTRAYYSEDFYVAYLRDPVGNKVSVFCVLDPHST